jgi:hypothetical protein
MRYLLIITALVLLSKAEANDTLTNAEIYNFNIGDTFDYRNFSSWSNQGQSGTTISYSRYIITNVFWSSDSSTIYISRAQKYPTEGADTLSITTPGAYAIVLQQNIWCGQMLTVDINSGYYFGRETNYIADFCDGEWHDNLFAKGLGVAINNVSGLSNFTLAYNDSATLIYYSGDSGTYGTPYTSFPTAINDLNLAIEKINVFPTLNNGIFTVELPNEISLPINFSVYDVVGKKVEGVILNNSKSTVNLPGISPGIYVWQIGVNPKGARTGKVVIY